jgi:hypothetical protein
MVAAEPRLGGKCSGDLAERQGAEMKQQAWAILVACALLASSCSTGGLATITEDAATASEVATKPASVSGEQVGPTAPPAPAPTAAPDPTATPIPPTPVPEPPSLLGGFEPGECFDNASARTDEALPGAPVDCQGEHEYEVFFVGESNDGPDVPYRFDTEFTDGLFNDFCDPATAEFAGAPWDVLPFGVTVWTPSETDWVAGDRAFACTAEAGLRSENIYKVGTAAGGTLVSGEGIVSRVTIGGQRDLYFSFQGSTLYPLTDGSFELPNLSPHVLNVGFLFAAPLQDVEASTSRSYQYNYETGEVTRLETGFDGWEIASPHFLVEVPAFVFAARETSSDDWDIYLSRTEDGVVALADSPLDDHWLTLTPGGSQIVYHSGGGIWIMNIDGSNQQQLTSEAAGGFESAVSPDGTRIAFASDRSGNDDIWIMNIDGSDPQNLTNHPAQESWPFFSADGSRIYFQTDRLGVRANIMMMELDGSNQSYYSFEFMTNGAILPDSISNRFAAELPTIAEVLDIAVEGVVGGVEGELTEVAHSSGRLIASLPAGWEFEEIAGDDPATMLAAASISAFSSTWASDGALLTVIAAASTGDFIARIDGAAAPNDDSCVEDRQSTEVDGSRTVIQREYSCGEISKAVVLGIYESSAQVGLLFEGQWDGDPSNQVDEGLITAIAASLQWG